MMTKQFENDNFVLYSPDSLKYITNDLEEILDKVLNKYKDLFSIDNFRKVQINYFDNIKDFRNYIYELRGENKSLPEYATGTYDNGMINAYIEPDIDEESSLYIKRKYLASHELFHIMYQELGWDKYDFNRITWFDEGMAQLFSGEVNVDDSFIKESLINVDNNINLNDLSSLNGFNDKEYRLSVIAVKYIYDKIGIDSFKKLMFNEDEIINYGESLINKIINNN